MNPIRPNLPPVDSPNAAPRTADAARVAAQRAFFDVALGKATAAAGPVPAAAPSAPTRAAAPAPRTDQPPAEAASRPMRPGSLLDIRV